MLEEERTMSDDLDFTIVASGNFGNFMWELPENIKENFRSMIQKHGKDGEMGISLIKEQQGRMIQILLCLLCGLTFSGNHAPQISENINKALRNIAEEQLKILKS